MEDVRTTLEVFRHFASELEARGYRDIGRIVGSAG